MASRDVTRVVMATAAASSFAPVSAAPATAPRFREGLGDDVRALHERVLEQTFGVAEGVWLGTPFHLNLEKESGELAPRMSYQRSRILISCSGAKRTTGSHWPTSGPWRPRCRTAGWSSCRV